MLEPETKVAAAVNPENKILAKMLERLFASLANGPSLNCKPHSSRQRFDLVSLARLKDVAPEVVLQSLLGTARAVKIVARVKPVVLDADEEELKDSAEIESAEALSVEPQIERQSAKESTAAAEAKAARVAWTEQQAILNKLRGIAEDSRTYENDTGVHVLNVGFPLLELPAGSLGSKRTFSRKILAPLAFISVNLTLRGGITPSVELECRNEGQELVVANTALLAWLEQQTGKQAGELFADEAGADPWKEICGIVKHVCKLVEIDVPRIFLLPSPPVVQPDGELKEQVAPATNRPAKADSPAEESSGDGKPAGNQPAELPVSTIEQLKLQPAPRSEAGDGRANVVTAAVVGLFPMFNQGLLRDTQAMVDGEPASGPVESYLKVDANLFASAPVEPAPVQEQVVKRHPRVFAEERLVSDADPSQSRAVKLARTSRGLVIHGPPGTGKSQTITNIIGDHLSRGQRVLLVCDKRTALDVVMNRLEGMGLGRLCAVVHDPQRDQRDLYKSIREQLDGLAEAQTYPQAEKQLKKMDEELQSLHSEISGYYAALMETNAARELSFHELIGKWLSLPATAVNFKEGEITGLTPETLEKHHRDLAEILQRGEAAGYSNNPWSQAAGTALKDFLAQPMDRFREIMSRVVEAAKSADVSCDPAILPFAEKLDLIEQSAKRSELGDSLERIGKEAVSGVLSRWATADIGRILQERQKLADVKPLIELVRSGPADAELMQVARTALPGVGTLGGQIAALDEYLAITAKWYAFVCFSKKTAAKEAIKSYGLPLSPENALRAKKFLQGLRARLILKGVNDELRLQPAAAAGTFADEELLKSLDGHWLIFVVLVRLNEEPALVAMKPAVVAALSELGKTEGRTFESNVSAPLFAALMDGLRKSPPRAKALAASEKTLDDANLFEPAWLAKEKAGARAGAKQVDLAQSLSDNLRTLENVLRVREGIAGLPAHLSIAVAQLVGQGVGSEAGITALLRTSLSGQILQRLKDDPNLQGVDGHRLRATFSRYGTLEAQKRRLVRELILNFWVGRQKQRLMASTGSRLNGDGAELRRRLMIRGERALRLRQVVAAGQETEGGDPLFDMRPVWMASPETVAQIFQRKALFDVVVFDEASQCRMEEALPVLLRAERVVVAGDPKQLPPTRFFESAIAASEEDEAGSDQELFETQQKEIEDLLGASLNIEIQECYLDVHYRSRNADLIAFSNQHFYGGRLQTIPGHPKNRARYAPLTLYRCDGAYEKNTNVAEAMQVCQIVQDLLKRAEPPTIGIACFNIQQRDRIVEQLDDLAAENSEFARRLSEARTRRIRGAHEGLFVKNLESVQGDVRDHMIISTTYGPDPKGRFYHRFGPLGRAGGGRRLNVLVTRARKEVHLVTSIPAGVYRALPPIPPGQAPGGGWLLFSYLAYAEGLADAYDKENKLLDGAAAESKAVVRVRQSRWPSAFSESLAEKLAEEKNVGSDVHWGNDGFCVDLALHHPTRAEDVTIGVICDLTRFAQAEDPIEWEIFRTAVLESQGWKLHRLWTPHFYRDGRGSVEEILKEAQEVAQDEGDRDAIHAG